MKRARRKVTAAAATALLLVGAAVAAAPTGEAVASNALISRTVTHSRAGWVTTMKYPDMVITVHSKTGPARMKAEPTTRTMSAATTTGTDTHYATGEVEFLAPDKEAATTTPTARTASLTATPALTTTAPGTSMAYDCVDIAFDNNGNGTNMGHYHGCDDQRLVKAYSTGSWYLYDRFKASGSMHDYSIWNPDEMTGVLIGIHYGAYNVIQDWGPGYSWSTGSCTTKTSTVTVGPSAAQYSTSYANQVCPEKEGLYDVTNTYMRTKWDGDGNGPSDGARMSWGHAAVHSPPRATAGRSILFGYWYE